MIAKPQILKLRPPLANLFQQIYQPLSTSPYQSKPEILSDNITYRPGGSSSSSCERPLVLMFGWLLSKSRHIYKYGDFYLGNNFDVLHVKIHPNDLLRPKRTFKVVDQMVDFLSESERSSQKLLVHGFSVGAYLHGELLHKLHSHGEVGKSIADRLVGQVMDSPVDVHKVSEGISKAITTVPGLQQSIQMSIAAYLHILDRPVTQYYRRSSAAFKENKLQLPTHFLYSFADPVGDAKHIEDVMNEWRARGITVSGRSWTDTPHVMHFMRYPIEYIDSLKTFLQTLDLIQPRQGRKMTEDIKERVVNA